MKNLTKSEPVTLATIIALAVGALISYGLNITDELAQFLTVAVPVLIAMWLGRSQVTPVEAAKDRANLAYESGKRDAAASNVSAVALTAVDPVHATDAGTRRGEV